MIEDIIDGRDVVGQPLLPLRKGNVRKTAQVQAVVIIAEKHGIADRDQGCPLPAQRDIGRPEITDRVDAAHRGDSGTGTDLRRKAHARLMEDRLAVRGHQIDFQLVAFHERAHLLAQIQAVIGMQPGIVKRRHALCRRQFPAEVLRIIDALGLYDPVVPAAVKIEGDTAEVQPVEGSPRHQADHVNMKTRGFHCFHCHNCPLPVS